MASIINTIVNFEIVKLGFSRKGNYWYRRFPEVIHVVGLQKSRWGNQFYVNLAIWVKQIAREEFPKVKDCHIQRRLNSIPDSPLELEQALDEEDSWKMDGAHRQEILKLALCNAEFVFFRELNSFEKIKNYVKNGHASRCAVTLSLKNLIQ